MPDVFVDPTTDETELAAAARLRIALDRRRGSRSRDAVELLALLSPGASNAQPPPDFVPKTGRDEAGTIRRQPWAIRRQSWRLPLYTAILWMTLVALGIFGPGVQLTPLAAYQLLAGLVLIIVLIPVSYLGDVVIQVRAIFTLPFAVGWWLALVPLFLAWILWLRTSIGGVLGVVVSAVVSVALVSAAGLATAWSNGSLWKYRTWETQLAPMLGFALGIACITPPSLYRPDTKVEKIVFFVAALGTPVAHVVAAASTLVVWNWLEYRRAKHRFLLAFTRHFVWMLLLAGWNVATFVGRGYWQITAGVVLIVVLYLLHRSWFRSKRGW